LCKNSGSCAFGRIAQTGQLRLTGYKVWRRNVAWLSRGQGKDVVLGVFWLDRFGAWSGLGCRHHAALEQSTDRCRCRGKSACALTKKPLEPTDHRSYRCLSRPRRQCGPSAVFNSPRHDGTAVVHRARCRSSMKTNTVQRTRCFGDNDRLAAPNCRDRRCGTSDPRFPTLMAFYSPTQRRPRRHRYDVIDNYPESKRRQVTRASACPKVAMKTKLNWPQKTPRPRAAPCDIRRVPLPALLALETGAKREPWFTGAI